MTGNIFLNFLASRRAKLIFPQMGNQKMEPQGEWPETWLNVVFLLLTS